MPTSIQNPGTVLKALLDEYQLNPTKLAKEIKLSQSAVRQIAIGQTKITVPAALRLAKFFGTTPDYWINLQTLSDLSLAAKDSKLNAVLKSISKAKKPAPGSKAQKTDKPVEKNAAKKPARGKKNAVKKGRTKKAVG
jgi:addiction module HigA family antidote